MTQPVSFLVAHHQGHAALMMEVVYSQCQANVLVQVVASKAMEPPVKLLNVQLLALATSAPEH
jgi:hypothetical protein